MCGPVRFADGKVKEIIVAGGFNKRDKTLARTEVYDLASNTWSTGQFLYW